MFTDLIGINYRLVDNWFNFINTNDYKNRPINYLEIGTFYGANLISFAFTYGLHNDSKFYCIDPWEDYNEYVDYKDLELSYVYNSFMKNIENSKLNDKVIINRGYSNIEIPKYNDDFFDIIYVDGNHKPEYALEDAVLSFRKLKNNGIMIFDDYGWNGSDFTQRGIDAFISGYKNKIVELGLNNSQYFIKKIIDFDEINNKYNSEYTNKLLNNKHIFYEIYNKCNKTFLNGSGSYLFDGIEYKYDSRTYKKQELLYENAKTATNILEIGTYMGHSLLIMLLANPNLKITCIDCDDTYTYPAIYVLNKYFNNAITFIHKDSLSAMQEINSKFDFFHIDGNLKNEQVIQDFLGIINLNNNNIIRVLFNEQFLLQDLQNQIDTKLNVIKKIIPDCILNNVYYEIQY